MTDAEMKRWRIDRFAARHGKHFAVDQAPGMACARCGSTEGVKLESSRTMYDWNGEGADPNAPLPLCRPCAEEHHDYWDEMWGHVDR